MQVELRPLSLSDGPDILDMLREIGPGENGFINSGSALSDREYPDWLRRQHETARGIGIRPEYVPQTVFWLYVDGRPVGTSKLRRNLTPMLRINGGHIGYCIRPSERGRGFGSLILAETLKQARERHLPRVLVTVHAGNESSCRVALANGGVEVAGVDAHGGREAGAMLPENDATRRFWIELAPPDGFRRLHIDDYEEMMALWRRTPGMGLTDADTHEHLLAFFERNPDLNWCRTEGGRIVGTVLCGHDRRRGYIYHAAVDVDSRGRGIGQTLVGIALDRLRTQKIAKCHLFCFADNAIGNSFWEANGWERRRDILIWSKNTIGIG